MAVNYNPKSIAINNPMQATDLYPNKTLVPGSDGSLTSSSVLINRIDEGALGYEDIRTLDAKYSMDISAVTKVYRKELFPFTFMADFNTKAPTSGDVHVIGEDRDQDVQFHDTMLNKLRLVSLGTTDSGHYDGGALQDASGTNKPYAIDSASNIGGKLVWKTLTTSAFADVKDLLVAGYAGTAKATADTTIVNGASALTDTVMYKAAANTGSVLENHMLLPLGWALGSGERSKGGTDAETYITKMAALLEGNYYKKVGYGANVLTTASAGQRIYGYIHESNGYASMPVATVHAMFEDLAIKINGSEKQLHEVDIRIHGIFWTADLKEFILILDFNYANLEVTLSATAANNVVLLEELQSASTEFSGGFTRMSSHALLGQYINMPDPVIQGSDRGAVTDYASSYLYDVEMRQNFCQIIYSPKIKISGTYLASQNRMKLNRPQKMRDDIMMKFKQNRTNVALYGPGASHKRTTASGDFINTSAGFFCYEMNPIRYTRQTLNFYAASEKMAAIKQFVANYARSVFAFQPSLQGNGVKQVLISRYMMSLIDEYIRYAQQEQNNVYGQFSGNQAMISGNNVDMGLKYNSITTPHGTLEFVIEPAFDYMTEVKLPSFVSSSRINPKALMVAIDKSKISTVSLRAPRLRGNIQTNSADYSMEDMICEETLEVLDPMSHMVTLVNLPE